MDNYRQTINSLSHKQLLWLLEKYHNLEKVGEILMSLFIRNMNMPRINRLYKCELDVRPSGTVLKVNNPITGKEEKYVVETISTPHGRLIDADELETHVDNWWDIGEYVFADSVRNADTIIEAEVAYE